MAASRGCRAPHLVALLSPCHCDSRVGRGVASFRGTLRHLGQLASFSLSVRPHAWPLLSLGFPCWLWGCAGFLGLMSPGHRLPWLVVPQPLSSGDSAPWHLQVAGGRQVRDEGREVAPSCAAGMAQDEWPRCLVSLCPTGLGGLLRGQNCMCPGPASSVCVLTVAGGPPHVEAGKGRWIHRSAPRAPVLQPGSATPKEPVLGWTPGCAFC